MVNNIQYTSVRRVLDNLLDHPLLRGVSMEQAIRYTLRFIAIFGFPSLYNEKIAKVKVEEYRGVLPCDLTGIIQVRDAKTKVALRSMTDTFTPALEKQETDECSPVKKKCKDQLHNVQPCGCDNDCDNRKLIHEGTFKTQGNIIYTSFKEGEVEIAYKSIPTDEDGYPMLIDNEVYLNALELYIKKQVFTVLFDLGKIQRGVLSNVQQEYAWAAGQLESEMKLPSISEMETLTRILNTMILPTRHFDNGFRNLGDREYIKIHN